MTTYKVEATITRISFAMFTIDANSPEEAEKLISSGSFKADAEEDTPSTVDVLSVKAKES